MIFRLHRTLYALTRNDPICTVHPLEMNHDSLLNDHSHQYTRSSSPSSSFIMQRSVLRTRSSLQRVTRVRVPQQIYQGMLLSRKSPPLLPPVGRHECPETRLGCKRYSSEAQQCIVSIHAHISRPCCDSTISVMQRLLMSDCTSVIHD